MSFCQLSRGTAWNFERSCGRRMLWCQEVSSFLSKKFVHILCFFKNISMISVFDWIHNLFMWHMPERNESLADNLKLNSTKSTAMIVSRPRVGREHLTYPTPIPGIQRIDMMKILGVSLSNTFSFNTHIDIALRQAAQSMYAFRVLRSHGLTGELGGPLGRHPPNTCQNVVYASPAWWGYADMGHRQRLQNFIFKITKVGFFAMQFPFIWNHVPLMKSFLHPCSVTITMYWHNSFLRLKKPHTISVTPFVSLSLSLSLWMDGWIHGWVDMDGWHGWVTVHDRSRFVAPWGRVKNCYQIIPGVRHSGIVNWLIYLFDSFCYFGVNPSWS